MTKKPAGRTLVLRHLEKLLAEQETALTAIRTTMALLQGHDRASSNGDAPVLAEALALDAARRARTTPAPQRPVRGTFAKKLRRQRAGTEKLLRRFDRETPRPAKEPRAMGVLLRHGYLEKRGDGYVRTDKPFTV